MKLGKLGFIGRIQDDSNVVNSPMKIGGMSRFGATPMLQSRLEADLMSVVSKDESMKKGKKRLPDKSKFGRRKHPLKEFDSSGIMLKSERFMLR